MFQCTNIAANNRSLWQTIVGMAEHEENMKGREGGKPRKEMKTWEIKRETFDMDT